MAFKVMLVPVDNSPLTDEVRDAGGSLIKSRFIGTVDATQAGQVANFLGSILPTSGFGLVAIQAALYAGAVQPSGAQVTAFIQYIALIQAGTNTATVESAIAALV